MNLNDLIIKAKAGDKDAIMQLINLYKPLVNKCSYKTNLKNYDMDDLKQYGFLSILNAIYHIDPDKDTAYHNLYLANAIRNNFFNLIRSNAQYKDESSLNISPNNDDYEILDIIEDPENIEDFIERKFTDNLLQEALSQLTEEEFDFIATVYFFNGTLKKYCDMKNIRYYDGRRIKKHVLTKLRNILSDMGLEY